MGDYDDRRRSDRKRGRDDDRDARRSKSDAPILNTFKVSKQLDSIYFHERKMYDLSKKL